jgi:hypothetical protein
MKNLLLALFVINALLALALSLLHDRSWMLNAVAAFICWYQAGRGE